MMRKAGWALLRNYDKIVRRVPIREGDEDYDQDERATVKVTGSVFTQGNAPSAAKAAYPTTGSFDGSQKKTPTAEHIFEGVRVETNSYEYSSMRVKQLVGEDHVLRGSENVPRQVLKPNSSGWRAYNDHYIGQMTDIIQGMFAEEMDINEQTPAADPENWHFTQNVVWGGTEHQHQHCDQGQAGSFHYEQIFPFVCIHGFGVHEFNMWLLPARMKREYGFPYRFPAKSMLFMRGDLVHAGGCSQPARAHLEFFPKAKAGWTKTKYPYWATTKQLDEWHKKKKHSWCLTCIPSRLHIRKLGKIPRMDLSSSPTLMIEKMMTYSRNLRNPNKPEHLRRKRAETAPYKRRIHLCKNSQNVATNKCV
jgi:hypothetical protein